MTRIYFRNWRRYRSPEVTKSEHGDSIVRRRRGNQGGYLQVIPSFQSLILYLSSFLSLVHSLPSTPLIHPFTYPFISFTLSSSHSYLYSHSSFLSLIHSFPFIRTGNTPKWYIEELWFLNRLQILVVSCIPFILSLSAFLYFIHPFNCNNPNWRVQNFKNESQTLVGSSFYSFILSSFHPFIHPLFILRLIISLLFNWDICLLDQLFLTEIC